MIAGSAVPCSIQPRARPSAARRELLAEAGGPRQLRGGLERGAALLELARLAVGLAEAEQQVAARRGVGRPGQLQGLERAREMATASS